jgi:pimeloyl-ACP methyl ester carboxylesterase
VSERRKRWPLALAMGVGLTAAGVAAARGATRRTAARHRAYDPHADDASVFDLDALGVAVHRLPSHDGGELYIVEKGPADARPLVLLHGITLAARVWGYQLRDLSDRYRVLAVDLRGHGSSRAGDAGFGLSLLAEDLRTALEALDLRDAIVVGHSMGGMTLMQFCGDHPDVLAERVAGVVFLATAPVIPLPVVLQRALRRVAPAVQRVGERSGWERLPRLGVGNGDVPYVLARRAFGRSPSHTHIELTRALVAECVPATSWSSGLGLVVHDAEEALAATKTPALVIGGELDRITPVAMSRRIAGLLPDAELHVLPDAGHQLMLERPDEVAELIDAFAARLPRTPV